jgi:hypothetical protein
VHGVILVVERTAHQDGDARFARLAVPVATAADRVRAADDLSRVADVREISGADLERPWGPLLRAPDAWFDIARTLAPRMVPLSELATVRRGVTSGANEFFYLTREEATRHGIEARFLVPLLRTPRHAPAITINPRALPIVAFACDLERSALPPGAARWIDAHAALASRPSFVGRTPWWSIPAKPARLFLSKAYDARFVQPFSPTPLVADQRVYAVDPRAGVELDVLAAALNGSLTALALECLGRASLGQGALEWSVGDIATLPVLDVRRLDARAIRAAFTPLSTRPIGTAAEERDAPDRAALDAALLGDDRLAHAMRDTLAAAVADRLERARAVSG